MKVKITKAQPRPKSLTYRELVPSELYEVQNPIGPDDIDNGSIVTKLSSMHGFVLLFLHSVNKNLDSGEVWHGVICERFLFVPFHGKLEISN